MTEITQFLNHHLRNTSDFSIRDEYPSLFDERFGGKSLIEKDKSRIVSHVGYVIRNYVHPQFQLRIGLIGSVVTDKEYQGQGRASRLIFQAIQQMQREAVSLVVLWSDQTQFYQNLGFYRGGRELDFIIDEKKSSDNLRFCRSLDRERDLDLIYSLYLKKQFRIERSQQEMAAYLRIPHLRCYVTEKEGKLDSYICINKGADFTGVIHEWGGHIEAVSENILGCQKRFFPSQPLALIAPYFNENLKFEKISSHWLIGCLGLMKVLDKEAIIKAYLDWNCFEDKALDFKEQDLEALTDEEFLITCFGKGEETKNEPLPFFLWGFDSI